jgi:hypothetical protein
VRSWPYPSVFGCKCSLDCIVELRVLRVGLTAKVIGWEAQHRKAVTNNRATKTALQAVWLVRVINIQSIFCVQGIKIVHLLGQILTRVLVLS